MSSIRGNGKKINILLAIICILLVGVLGAIFVTSHNDEKKEAQRLEKLADDQQTGIDDYESVKEHAAELEKEDGSETTENSGDSEETSSEQKSEDDSDAKKSSDSMDSTETADDEENARTISGVVCWGDDLINGTASETYSYMAVLRKLLTEKGYTELTVVDKTLQGGGTLSMMKMAGVSDEVLQGYITEHQQAAKGAKLNVTETGIRDLTEEQMTRNDMDCIPVIFMGYYGGWNHDPAELAQQQENILNTFENKDEFIVVGTRPLDGTVTSDALDQVLSQKWGEHYISLASVTNQPSATYEAQQAMAEAVLQKLEELGYISKN